MNNIENFKKNTNFVLFYPASICLNKLDSSYKYTFKNGMFYPCMLGILRDNECINVITGKKYNIIENEFWNKIRKDSKIISNPAIIGRDISNSLENLQLINEYLDANGRLGKKEINKNSCVSYRLNYILHRGNFDYHYFGFFPLCFNEFLLKKIELENLKSLKAIENVRSGQKAKDDEIAENDVVLKLTKKLNKFY